MDKRSGDMKDMWLPNKARERERDVKMDHTLARDKEYF